MNRRFYVSVLLILLLLVGCTVNSPKSTGKAKIDIDKLIIITRVISEDKESFKAEIKIKNNTGYDFLPSGIFARPYTVTIEGKANIQKDLPILFEAYLVSPKLENNEFLI